MTLIFVPLVERRDPLDSFSLFADEICNRPGGFGSPGVRDISLSLIILTPRQEDLELLLCADSLFVDFMLRRISGGRDFFFLDEDESLVLIFLVESPFLFICFNIIIKVIIVSAEYYFISWLYF
mgnify:FL=1